jgi:hypothetical protein
MKWVNGGGVRSGRSFQPQPFPPLTDSHSNALPLISHCQCTVLLCAHDIHTPTPLHLSHHHICMCTHIRMVWLEADFRPLSASISTHSRPYPSYTNCSYSLGQGLSIHLRLTSTSLLHHELHSLMCVIFHVFISPRLDYWPYVGESSLPSPSDLTNTCTASIPNFHFLNSVRLMERISP